MGFLPNGRGGGEGRGRRPTNNVWVRLGGPTKERNQNDVRKDTLCKFWATGRCFKGNRCPYMHSQSHDTKIAHSSERDKLKSDDNKKEMPICKLIAPLQRHTGFNVCEQADTDIAYPPAGDEPKTDNNMEMLCNVSIIATLQGHTKAITGIALPSIGDNLYSGSKDGTLRVWNCHTGLCERVINLGAEIFSMIHEGPWIFMGFQNLVKAWNCQKDVGFNLDGPIGQVCVMDFGDDKLFAGTESGQILVWKLNSESETDNPFQPEIALEGHTNGVVCITIGYKMLYSGSTDGTIKQWDLDTLQCLRTVKRHSSAVMSLACWNNYLVSCSLDGTIKAWDYTQEGDLEVCYTHEEEQGVLALGGMNIPVMPMPMPNQDQRRDILLCSRDDHSVHLYELPSFEKKGQIVARQEARSIHIQDGTGVFFIGDATGIITVGKITQVYSD